MNHQENKMDELAQSENEDQQQQNSAVHSIDVNPIDLVEIVIEMGNGVVDVASAIVKNIDINF
ncbi:hypothetical protein NDN11_10375 [Acinetobacter sp. C26M]|uniref:hypothetical protein n=1 Tax=unclassified Acinetobacter TaxID=196816 RepID=UPI00203728FC|nr:MULTISPECIES: hypothetical protein [unclassified Acinetobacter]USA45139.1 hypothetical protein NDN11_10375 [Acinetobacter sp. C26M]USA48641.1 hypothetical protein NDN12_10375 [Acinetobacter sp. C26G]